MTREQMYDAHAIAQGACNPRAIARTLVASIDTDSHESTLGQTTSPATRLILHQLVYVLTGIDLYCTDLAGFTYDGYLRDMAAVQPALPQEK